MKPIPENLKSQAERFKQAAGQLETDDDSLHPPTRVAPAQIYGAGKPIVFKNIQGIRVNLNLKPPQPKRNNGGEERHNERNVRSPERRLRFFHS